MTTESVTMATFQLSARRLLLAGGFAVAVTAAPAIAVFPVPTTDTAAPAAQCPNGEEEDVFSGACVPHTVPNSGAVPDMAGGGPFNSIPGNPNLPSIRGIPCTGANTGQCIGLAESQGPGPIPQPRSTVGHSPTVTSP